MSVLGLSMYVAYVTSMSESLIKLSLGTWSHHYIPHLHHHEVGHRELQLPPKVLWTHQLHFNKFQFGLLENY